MNSVLKRRKHGSRNFNRIHRSQHRSRSRSPIWNRSRSRSPIGNRSQRLSRTRNPFQNQSSIVNRNGSPSPIRNRSQHFKKIISTFVPTIHLRNSPSLPSPGRSPSPSAGRSRAFNRSPSRKMNIGLFPNTSDVSASLKQLGALIPTRAIVACDENENYIQFWEPIAQHWKQVHNIKPTLFFVSSTDAKINKTIGDVILISPISGVPTSLIAQVVRLLGPAMFPEDVCVVCDIDLFLLNKQFFTRYLSNVPKNNFASLNRYPSTISKISMCYQVAQGKLFGQIFGCNGTISQMNQVLKSWCQNSKDWSADENILTSTLRQWSRNNPNRWNVIHTPGLWGNPGNLTISRYHNSNYDKNLLSKFHYVEFEPPRPLLSNQSFIKTILEKTIPGFVFPSITYLGKNTGKPRHPWDLQRQKVSNVHKR